MGKKYFAWSFDDGLEQDKKIIGILKEYRLGATFHLNSGLFGDKTYEGRIGNLGMTEMPAAKYEAKAVMSAYNKINGVYCANNRELCTDILRGERGFDGIVMTDWLSTGEDRADEALCLSAGADLIMPGGKKVVMAQLNAHKEGRLSLDTLRQSCGRVLEEIFE